MTRRVLAWCVRDVFRHARSTGLLAALVALTAIASAVVASARVNSATGCLELLGGWLRPGTTGAPDTQSRDVLFGIAFAIGDVLGPLVGLLATAGFVPAFLDPAAAAVVFAKPISRPALLLGRSAAVVVFAAAVSGLLIAAVGLSAGLATGVWSATFWLCWPVFLIQFLAYYSVSVFLGVATRSTVAAMLGSVFFWLLSWGISFGRHTLTHVHLDEAAPEFGRLVGWVYYLFPKPVDLSLALHRAMGVDPQGTTNIGLRRALESGDYSAGLAAVSAAAVAVVFLALAAYELDHTDY
jgi:ABC-type transport system involved in multi-copper enzyme maturation permease subunit